MSTTAVKEDGVLSSMTPQPESAVIKVVDWPLENPTIYSRPDDPLCDPHPGEPGVKADGTAAPLENPGLPLEALA